MTGPELTEVELDRLADYAAGVLDPADERAVAVLIAAQPRWARAHQAIVAADRSVRAQLHSYARMRITPMPADVVARIDRALSPPASTGARAVVRTRQPVVARRHARRAWGVLAAAAAAVVAIFGGVWVIGGNLNHAGTVTAANAPQAGSAMDKSVAGAPGTNAGGYNPLTAPPQYLATGTNYEPGTLALFALASAAPAPDAVLPPGTERATVDTGLEPCLAAVRAAHPGVITKVDRARFAGTPAFIVLIVTPVIVTPVIVTPAPTGSVSKPRELVVAVSLDCASAGAHELGSQLVP